MFTISELAKKGNVRSNTIRYYERLQLIVPEGHSSAGYRLYSVATVRTLKFILNAKTLGFTLNEIKILLDLRTSDTATCYDMVTRVKNRLMEAKRSIKQLTYIQKALTKLVNDCPGDHTPVHECPIVDYLYPHDEGAKT